MYVINRSSRALPSEISREEWLVCFLNSPSPLLKHPSLWSSYSKQQKRKLWHMIGTLEYHPFSYICQDWSCLPIIRTPSPVSLGKIRHCLISSLKDTSFCLHAFICITMSYIPPCQSVLPDIWSGSNWGKFRWGFSSSWLSCAPRQSPHNWILVLPALHSLGIWQAVAPATASVKGYRSFYPLSQWG